ncbi:hypothetical protein B0J17DRAFT_718184 [Rhizoctonia solani]|nr:hypothetical protein B0J17DRAFT_718184 [Rhizoctonia solani]
MTIRKKQLPLQPASLAFSPQLSASSHSQAATVLTPESSPPTCLSCLHPSSFSAQVEYLYVSEYFYKHSDSMAHATDPPVSFLLIACNDTLPWLTPVHARESSGVTVRDVLEAISEVTHIQIEESVTQLLPTDKDRAQLYQAYHDRVKRNGGADKEGILAVDWLGRKTSFVCLARDEAVARKRVVEEYMWPFVFTLKLKTRKNTFLA